VVERAAGAADDPCQLLPHPPQAAIRSSISSIFAAIRTRNVSEGAAERRAARRYSAISASVKPTACASLIARRKRTVSSS